MRQIPPDHLHSVWPEVKEYISIVKEQQPDTWLVEDVYAEIKAGKAVLYVVDGGCCVVQPGKDPWTSEPYLHVWIAYCGIHGAIDTYLPELDQIARNAGFKSLTLRSKRRGFAKAGFEEKTTMFERRL